MDDCDELLVHNLKKQLLFFCATSSSFFFFCLNLITQLNVYFPIVAGLIFSVFRIYVPFVSFLVSEKYIYIY